MQITKLFFLAATAASAVYAAPAPSPDLTILPPTKGMRAGKAGASAAVIIVDKVCNAIPRCKKGREDFIADVAKWVDEARNPDVVIKDLMAEVAANTEPSLLEKITEVVGSAMAGVMGGTK
ncbi:hypothetical protein H072_5789 [Dactylellina haptotyla CBS 200.50]|uniref:Uncharacterized protein n=1 Tax=Dactylellina haptotyla (strain CBS 200.50) TaxID=1284197 RepID=S8ABW8_DACHA|nr:hypothetical protein H072_5789 [Dactylellina haptotyla CBS 200.50]